MKNIILSTITLIALSFCSLAAGNSKNPDEVALLREEIKRQELILQALKDKLAAHEIKRVLIISVTSEGLSTHGKRMSLTELEEKLEKLPDDTGIRISAEPTVSFKEVKSVMELCTKVGLKDVALSTTKVEPAGTGQPR